MDQFNLFGEASSLPPPYVPKQEHLRNRLQSILNELQAAEYWPWPPVIVRQYRELTLPYLYERLEDVEEAAHWEARFEAEISRLEAVAEAA